MKCASIMVIGAALRSGGGPEILSQLHHRPVPCRDRARTGRGGDPVHTIGVKETVPYVSTATRIIPIGAAINLVKSGAGGGGTLTGSVTSGIEAKDTVSSKTLAAAIRDLTPGAFDLSSNLDTMDTSRAVARGVAPWSASVSMPCTPPAEQCPDGGRGEDMKAYRRLSADPANG